MQPAQPNAKRENSEQPSLVISPQKSEITLQGGKKVSFEFQNGVLQIGDKKYNVRVGGCLATDDQDERIKNFVYELLNANHGEIAKGLSDATLQRVEVSPGQNKDELNVTTHTTPQAKQLVQAPKVTKFTQQDVAVMGAWLAISKNFGEVHTQISRPTQVQQPPSQTLSERSKFRITRNQMIGAWKGFKGKSVPKQDANRSSEGSSSHREVDRQTIERSDSQSSSSSFYSAKNDLLEQTEEID